MIFRTNFGKSLNFPQYFLKSGVLKKRNDRSYKNGEVLSKYEKSRDVAGVGGLLSARL